LTCKSQLFAVIYTTTPFSTYVYDIIFIARCWFDI